LATLQPPGANFLQLTLEVELIDPALLMRYFFLARYFTHGMGPGLRRDDGI
jgi:hypothetical protein